MTKHTIVFERTVVERVTHEVDLPDNVTERDIKGWLEYGYMGMCPLDQAPEQFPNRASEASKWKIASSDPPLADPPEPKKRTRRSPG